MAGSRSARTGTRLGRFREAGDGVAAAAEIQRGHAAHRWPEGTVLRVRVGLHTGEPLLTGDNYVGLDVHRAARVMSAGHGGQVLVRRQRPTSSATNFRVR